MKLEKNLLLSAFIFLFVTQSGAQQLGSLNFNGEDNYVEIADSPLNTIGSGDFTIEAWISGKEDDQATHPMILSNRGDGAFGGGILFFFHSIWGNSQSKMLCFQVNGNNYLHIDNGSFNGNILDGQCRHVAVSRAGDVLSFFVDGNEIGTKTIPSASTVYFDGPLWIGKDRATNNTFNGLISQCRIWNIARTQSQISESKDMSLEGNENGLIAYWELNNETSQTVTDKTQQYDGVLGGSPDIENEDPSWSEIGCVEEETVSSVGDYENYSLEISPNPTSGLIKIQHQGTKKVTLKIIDVHGRLVSLHSFNTSVFNLDIGGYENGIYFFQLSDGKYTVNRKIIKS